MVQMLNWKMVTTLDTNFAQIKVTYYVDPFFELRAIVTTPGEYLNPSQKKILSKLPTEIMDSLSGEVSPEYTLSIEKDSEGNIISTTVEGTSDGYLYGMYFEGFSSFHPPTSILTGIRKITDNRDDEKEITSIVITCGPKNMLILGSPCFAEHSLLMVTKQLDFTADDAVWTATFEDCTKFGRNKEVYYKRTGMNNWTTEIIQINKKYSIGDPAAAEVQKEIARIETECFYLFT
jgi:hypothetical protein